MTWHGTCCVPVRRKRVFADKSGLKIQEANIWLVYGGTFYEKIMGSCVVCCDVWGCVVFFLVAVDF